MVSLPPPRMSMRGPRSRSDIAAHSMGQPGRPRRSRRGPTEGASARAVARRAPKARFVDVRDVLRVTNGSPARLEMTDEDVEGEERARVTEVRRVVGRDTADVESDGTGTRTEREDRAPARVVETEH